jgi:hypothetical protein
MLQVRRALTEIMLEVTNDELYEIAANEYARARRKAAKGSYWSLPHTASTLSRKHSSVVVTPILRVKWLLVLVREKGNVLTDNVNAHAVALFKLIHVYRCEAILLQVLLYNVWNRLCDTLIKIGAMMVSLFCSFTLYPECEWLCKSVLVS